MISAAFRIRCSAIHQIMADVKPAGLTDAERSELAELRLCAKGELLTPTGRVATFTDKRKARRAELEHLKANPRPAELPKGARTYCDGWLQNHLYGRKTAFTAKQTEKGTRTEDDGIDLLREYLSDPFLPDKNKRRIIGEYIEGECDIDYSPTVYDIKSAYTHAGMDLHATVPSRAHYCQLQGYGHLFGASRLALARVLCNMPEDMIEREARYAVRSAHGPDYTEAQYDRYLKRLTRRYTYDDVPLELRVHVVEFPYDPDFVASVIERVKMCRAYIDRRFAALPEKKKTAALAYIRRRGEKLTRLRA